MRRISKWSLSVLTISMMFTACSKDDHEPIAIPSVTDVELGSANNKIAYTGSDLHIEAAIAAPGNIANIKVTIKPAEAGGWTFDSTYTTGFVGLKNAVFHKHIDIPAEAATGSYQLRFVVTDQHGQKKEFTEKIDIKTDPSMPLVTGLEVALGSGGTDLHLGADISAPNKIAKVEVEIHGKWEKEQSYTDAAMVGQTNYHFHKHIDVTAAPAGHYHVHFKVTDQSGKVREFEAHFDKP